MITPGLQAVRTNLYIHRELSPETSSALRNLIGFTRNLLADAGISYKIAQHGAYQFPLLSEYEYGKVSRQHGELLHTPFEKIEEKCQTVLFGRLGSEVANVALDGVKSYCISRQALPRRETYSLGLTTSDPQLEEERRKIYRGLATVAGEGHINHKTPELPLFITHRAVPEWIVDSISQQLPLMVDLQQIEIDSREIMIAYPRRSA